MPDNQLKDCHGWDAVEVLALVNPESAKRTCPAVKKSGKKDRCKNPTPSESRLDVEMILDDIAQSDPSIVHKNVEVLTTLAKSLVCWHHGDEKSINFVIGRFKRLINDEALRQQQQQQTLARYPPGLLRAPPSETLTHDSAKSSLRSTVLHHDQHRPTRSVRRSASRATTRASSSSSTRSFTLIKKEEPVTPRQLGLGNMPAFPFPRLPRAPNNPEQRVTPTQAPVDSTNRRRQTTRQPMIDDTVLMQNQALALRVKELEDQTAKQREEKKAVDKQLKVATRELRRMDSVKKERDAFSAQVEELYQEINERDERIERQMRRLQYFEGHPDSDH